MEYGLKDTELQEIRRLLASSGNVDSAILFGSRAKGCHKPFSDVDITLIGESLTRTDLIRLADAFEGSLLPYVFDLSIFSLLTDEAVKDHIRRVGIVIYER